MDAVIEEALIFIFIVGVAVTSASIALSSLTTSFAGTPRDIIQLIHTMDYVINESIATKENSTLYYTVCLPPGIRLVKLTLTIDGDNNLIIHASYSVSKLIDVNSTAYTLLYRIKSAAENLKSLSLEDVAIRTLKNYTISVDIKLHMKSQDIDVAGGTLHNLKGCYTLVVSAAYTNPNKVAISIAGWR